ncbi:MAG TPA: hypothetical protein VGP93_11090, partial [Polyangiaceae bacterium]|nr:hypothetical protein [Polyangiaceae bacterium]
LREVGGDAVVLCPVDDLEQWTRVVLSLLRGDGPSPALDKRLERASRYSWTRHAAVIGETYRKLASSPEA